VGSPRSYLRISKLLANLSALAKTCVTSSPSVGRRLCIGDNKQCISSLRINVEDLSVEDQILAFWSKEPSYAKYLLSNFESAWTKGVDAQERISELLKEGADQNAIVNSKVQLDGSQSIDPNNESFTYAWVLMLKPKGSKAQLISATTVQPTLTPDKQGTYVIQLVVTGRHEMQSAADTVTVTAVNKLPK
jgi:hypothetical protein